MADDPLFPYMVGRLVGSAEMAATVLRTRSESDGLDIRIADALDANSRWFIQAFGETPHTPEPEPWPGEQTRALPR